MQERQERPFETLYTYGEWKAGDFVAFTCEGKEGQGSIRSFIKYSDTGEVAVKIAAIDTYGKNAYEKAEAICSLGDIKKVKLRGIVGSPGIVGVPKIAGLGRRISRNT